MNRLLRSTINITTVDLLKKSDVEDKRVLRIFLSPMSKDLRIKLSQARDQTNDDLLKPFTLEEKVLLKRFLRELQN